jgi:hypothetical protein
MNLGTVVEDQRHNGSSEEIVCLNRHDRVEFLCAFANKR